MKTLKVTKKQIKELIEQSYNDGAYENECNSTVSSPETKKIIFKNFISKVKKAKRNKHNLYFNEINQTLVHYKEFDNDILVGKLTHKNTIKLKNFLKGETASYFEIRRMIALLNN